MNNLKSSEVVRIRAHMAGTVVDINPSLRPGMHVGEGTSDTGEDEAFLYGFCSVHRCGNCCDGRVWQQSSGRGNIA